MAATEGEQGGGEVRLWLDTEFNGFKGELLSIALVPEAGPEFYEILAFPANIDSWVAEHVIPVMQVSGIVDRSQKLPWRVRNDLQAYLMQFDSVHVIADWPEDIVHFCHLLLTEKPGERINTPPLTMEIVRTDAPSKVPHNALGAVVASVVAFVMAIGVPGVVQDANRWREKYAKSLAEEQETAKTCHQLREERDRIKELARSRLQDANRYLDAATRVADERDALKLKHDDLATEHQRISKAYQLKSTKLKRFTDLALETGEPVETCDITIQGMEVVG